MTATPTKLEVTRADGAKMILRQGFTGPTSATRDEILAGFAKLVRRWEKK